MNKEIFIICNSPAALAEISSGNWPNLPDADLFTCNLAYSHFRTNGKHFNIFSDPLPINDFLSHPNWHEIYNTYQYNKIKFVINKAMVGKDFEINKSESCKAEIDICPVSIPASSAIGALFYTVCTQHYDKIHLIGYTLNEWEGLEAAPELRPKLKAFEWVDLYYKKTSPRPYLFTFTKL